MIIGSSSGWVNPSAPRSVSSTRSSRGARRGGSRGTLGAEVVGEDGAVRDWVEWHLAYQDPESALSRRLERVRQHLAKAIDDAPAGQVSLVSLCAGQGHDVLG